MFVGLPIQTWPGFYPAWSQNTSTKLVASQKYWQKLFPGIADLVKLYMVICLELSLIWKKKQVTVKWMLLLPLHFHFFFQANKYAKGLISLGLSTGLDCVAVIGCVTNQTLDLWVASTSVGIASAVSYYSECGSVCSSLLFSCWLWSVRFVIGLEWGWVESRVYWFNTHSVHTLLGSICFDF